MRRLSVVLVVFASRCQRLFWARRIVWAVTQRPEFARCHLEIDLEIEPGQTLGLAVGVDREGSTRCQQEEGTISARIYVRERFEARKPPIERLRLENSRDQFEGDDHLLSAACRDEVGGFIERKMGNRPPVP